MIDIYGSHYEIIHCIECVYVMVHWRAGLTKNNFLSQNICYEQPKIMLENIYNFTLNIFVYQRECIPTMLCHSL